ncbi:helix-turn-helix transcriptional regulator [Albidovulum sediminis]|uniref:Helix-turn-helix transcriptional regulator n=1 Tax=Albidovulum sediminis TaxID=3066345 RepID=A0ABT2NN70_9RHOB|nr:helix-turn-helix transcriptional regulator [Defluviimonas sediminis]MCT8329548.1 helix-turn-helix transcriptional regulator [Defluviimonas sediminis]
MAGLPNIAESQLAETIRRMGRPGFESALLAFFRRIVAPDNLIILAYRDAGPPQVLFRQTELPQVFAQLDDTYLGGAYLLDPYHDLHVSRVAAGVYRLTDIAPDAFQRSRYFTEYYRQTTLIDELTFIAYPVAGVSLNICIGRDAASGRVFSATEAATCQRIAPVVVALAEQHWAGLAAETGPADDVAGDLIAALREHGIDITPRQAEVALLILRGHSTASIGLRMGLSPQTVKVFRRQLYARCGLSSQAELFALMLPLLRGS